jgi:curli biogenesis system outer membrane secretion channel CsgG
MNKKTITYSAVLIMLVFLTGCATFEPIVQPTYEEMQAARSQKKTVAIVEFGERNSSIRDIQSLALSRLENFLSVQFNLVERLKINKVLAERSFAGSDDVESLVRIGKILGADYAIIGDGAASVSGPEVCYKSYTKYDRRTKTDKFYGTIWQQITASGTVSLKFIDIADGIVVYSDTKSATANRNLYTRKYDNDVQYREDIKNQRIFKGGVKTARIHSGMKQDDLTLISDALANAMAAFQNDIKQRFAHTGEVLEIFSDYEVLVNLGSAYGIRPGQILVVWGRMTPIHDPKTGITTVPKERKATLTVMKVTSGLTCIAKGSKDEVRCIRPGDEVGTFN